MRRVLLKYIDYFRALTHAPCNSRTRSNTPSVNEGPRVHVDVSLYRCFIGPTDSSSSSNCLCPYVVCLRLGKGQVTFTNCSEFSTVKQKARTPEKFDNWLTSILYPLHARYLPTFSRISFALHSSKCRLF